MSALCGNGMDEYLGPPPVYAEPVSERRQARTELVTARITAGQKAALDKICRREFVSRSELLYEMISSYIERDEIYAKD